MKKIISVNTLTRTKAVKCLPTEYFRAIFLAKTKKRPKAPSNKRITEVIRSDSPTGRGIYVIPKSPSQTKLDAEVRMSLSCELFKEDDFEPLYRTTSYSEGASIGDNDSYSDSGGDFISYSGSITNE